MPHNRTSAAPEKASAPATPFPVVAIGASAGGIDALKSFFGKLPRDSGMGFSEGELRKAGRAFTSSGTCC